MNAPRDWNLIAAGPSRIHLRPEHLIPDSHVCTVNRAIDVREQGIRVNYAAFADGPDAIWKPLNLERHIFEDPSIQLWVNNRTVTQKATVKRPARKRKGVPHPDFLRACAQVFPQPIVKALDKFAEKYLMDPAEEFQIDAPGPQLMSIWDRVLPSCAGLRVLPHGNIQDVNDKNTWRNAFTTLCALERIWMFKPKTVRILCADMCGPWVDGWTEEQCTQHEAKKVADGKTRVILDRWKHEKYALEESIRKAKAAGQVETVEWFSPQFEVVAA